MYLFGGDKGWLAEDWTASDDRVRGGNSQSYLRLYKTTVEFHGNLDIKTLGGAGFASQRTTGDDRTWDLSAYDGVELKIEKADEKRYTFILKDSLLPPDPSNGREQSTISYEYDFTISPSTTGDEATTIFIAWKDFRATYRGKDKKDAPNLDRKKIKRVSLMQRSFFGTQEGAFSLTLDSISASSKPALFNGENESGGTAETEMQTSFLGRWLGGGWWPKR